MSAVCRADRVNRKRGSSLAEAGIPCHGDITGHVLPKRALLCTYGSHDLRLGPVGRMKAPAGRIGTGPDALSDRGGPGHAGSPLALGRQGSDRPGGGAARPSVRRPEPVSGTRGGGRVGRRSP
ncbi:hypothetical protein GCM10010129_47760 [Streptomyces fumigatiscleroticus]|nr:hypothetical protein GCM10010129_47760 [Streptomyces fumigatiscleroticus]